MNLKIAICDDEKKDISKLQKYISQYNIKTDNNIMVSTYNSASKLLLDYNNFSFDVVLLDIEMPNINGLDIARQLRDVTMIYLLYLLLHIQNICMKVLKFNHFSSL